MNRNSGHLVQFHFSLSSFYQTESCCYIKKNYNVSNTHSDDGLVKSLVFSANVTASISLTLSMLENMLAMLNNTKMI